MRDSAPHFRTIKPVVYILGLCGGALFIVLLIREGAGQVGSAIAQVGWGLLALTLYHLLQTLNDAAGWSALIPKEQRVPLSRSFFLHWIGESINNLLPTGRVGGDIVMTRGRGVSWPGSCGSTGRGLYSPWKSARYIR